MGLEINTRAAAISELVPADPEEVQEHRSEERGADVGRLSCTAGD
jgi:hypothetical protein